MPTFKEYNGKLARLRSTSKMTRTMKMVAANKLRRAQSAERTAAEFREATRAVLARLRAVAPNLAEHPLVVARDPVRAVHVLLVSSDRGLCGGFNHALNRGVAAWVQKQTDAGVAVRMSFCGRRGYLFFRSRTDVRTVYEGVSARPTFDSAHRIGRQVRRSFLTGESDEVYVAANRPRGALSQEVAIDRLLPLQAPAAAGEAEARPGEVLFEAGAQATAVPLLERWVSLNLFLALLGSASAEHAARMAAMENSTTNAEKLIERYTLLRNRARQAAVTRELLEIVAGAEALR